MRPILQQLTTWTVLRPRLTLALFAGVVLIAAWIGSSIRIDGDLARLLPQDASSVQGIEHVADEYGDQIGRLTLVVGAVDSTVDLRASVHELQQAIEPLPGIDRVVVRDPRSDLDPFRLLYLDLEDVETITHRVTARIREEKRRVNPLFVQLDDKPLDSLDFSDIEDKYGGDGDGYYTTPDGRLLLFVHPNFPSSNLSETRALLADVAEATAPIEEANDLSIGMTGRYQKRVDQQDLIAQDLGRATGLVLGLLFLFLLYHQRSIRSLVVVLIPLISGTVVTVAIARLLFADLNILTSFLLSILMGMGIDYGLHLVDRLRSATGGTVLERCHEALEGAGRANFYAAVTTVIGIGSLAMSDFRAFHEFGVIASLGVLAILAAYAIATPPLVAVLNVEPTVAATKRATLSRHRPGLVILTLITIATVAGIGGLRFDRSLDALAVRDLESSRLDEIVNETLGTSQTPAVVLVDTSEDARVVVEALDERRSGPGGETIGAVLSRDSLLPRQQHEKLKLYAELQSDLRAIDLSGADPELRALADELDETLARGAITAAHLPRSVTAPLSRRADGEVVLVMPNADLGDFAASQAFAAQLERLPTTRAEVRGVGEVQLLHEILELTERSAPRMLFAAMLGIFLVAGFGIGWRKAGWLTLGNVLSFSFGLAMLALLDIPLNFMNIIVLPIVLALSVDATFHREILHEKYGADPAAHAVARHSVIGAFVTSLIGFAVLQTASHAGLRSVGEVATVTLLAALVCQLTFYRIAQERW